MQAVCKLNFNFGLDIGIYRLNHLKIFIILTIKKLYNKILV